MINSVFTLFLIHMLRHKLTNIVFSTF